jgi:lipid-A-disaccharide synthase
MTIYFVAGEASADNHGAALMHSLRKTDDTIQFIGRGGSKMRGLAGERFRNWIGDAAVLGLWDVIRKYGYFREQFRLTLKEIQKSKPDAVVLIDYPGFNLRLAHALRRKIDASSVRSAELHSAGSETANRIFAGQTARSGIFQGKIIYYISPQVWAWNRGRIKKMARFLDLMLCIFPFEVDLYNKARLRAMFVGHPMLERLPSERIEVERDPNLIGLFPGSRLPEVRKIFPVMLETAHKLRKQNRNAHFEVAAASEELAAAISEMLGRCAPDRQVVQIKVGETAAIMQRVWVGIVASGSATLEAAYFRMPFVLIYKIAWPTYLPARLVVSVKYLGMPNVLAEKEIVPEFIQHRAKPEPLAKAVSRLIENPSARDRMISEFDAIIDQLGEGKPSQQAAEAIIEEIGRSI